MLSCKEVIANASDFNDKNLPWHRALSYKLHFLMCKHCNRFIHQFMTSITVTGKFGLQKASIEEVDGIVGLVSNQKPDISS